MTARSRDDRRAPPGFARTKAKVLDDFFAEIVGEDDAALEPLSKIAQEVPRVAPSTALRDRILASTEKSHRFDDLEARVAELLDVTPAAAGALLRGIDGPPGAWDGGPRSGVALLHLDGGPSVKDAVTGFVRVEVGAEFPEHSHVGDEVVLVLQGAFEDSDGTVFRAGDEAWMPAGSTHRFRSLGPARLVGLAIVHGGVIVDGQTIGPGDPRA